LALVLTRFLPWFLSWFLLLLVLPVPIPDPVSGYIPDSIVPDFVLTGYIIDNGIDNGLGLIDNGLGLLLAPPPARCESHVTTHGSLFRELWLPEKKQLAVSIQPSALDPRFPTVGFRLSAFNLWLLAFNSCLTPLMADPDGGGFYGFPYPVTGMVLSSENAATPTICHPERSVNLAALSSAAKIGPEGPAPPSYRDQQQQSCHHSFPDSC
jgi:hypothetical protein